MWVLTEALIRESEEHAVKSGAFSFRELMLRAGNTAARIIDEKYSCANKRIALICGNGNNGGDGFVIAKYLYEHNADVCVITPMGPPKTDNALYYYNKLQPVNTSNVLTDQYDIIIDALFGIGLNRSVDKGLCELFEQINNLSAIKVAIDIPSGIHADTGRILGACINADLTITFIALKPCFVLPEGSDYCGEVVVADIGVPTLKCGYEIIENPHFKKRRHNSHKGSFGTALLICGCYSMAGAAILAAKAALRSGVGIAKCILCDGIYTAFTSALPEAVCLPVKQSKSGSLPSSTDILSALKGCNALLFGCGVSQTEDTKEILYNIIENSTIPTVIDADGINLLSKNIELLEKAKAPLILTPHPAEMARLCGCSVKEIEADRIGKARDFSVKNRCILVLKGADTIIAEPSGKISFCLNGNPGMATAGSGDVLAGITVSLLAQGLSPADAAKAAVYLHAEAGDRATLQRSERSVIASDIIEAL